MNKVPFNPEHAKAGRTTYLQSTGSMVAVKSTLDNVAQIVLLHSGCHLLAFNALYHDADDGFGRQVERPLSLAERDRLLNLTLDQRRVAARHITKAGGEDPCGLLRFNADPTYYITNQPADFFLTYPDDPIAEGANYHLLTVSQVEYGYRLLTAEEMAGPQRPDAEYWNYHKTWKTISHPCMPKHSNSDTYRTKLPPGQYTPKPKVIKRVPKTLADLPDRPFFLKNEHGTIKTEFYSNIIESYIRDNYTYSTSLHGPWFLFWKEVEV